MILLKKWTNIQLRRDPYVFPLAICTLKILYERFFLFPLRPWKTMIKFTDEKLKYWKNWKVTEISWYLQVQVYHSHSRMWLRRGYDENKIHEEQSSGVLVTKSYSVARRYNWQSGSSKNMGNDKCYCILFFGQKWAWSTIITKVGRE